MFTMFHLTIPARLLIAFVISSVFFDSYIFFFQSDQSLFWVHCPVLVLSQNVLRINDALKIQKAFRKNFLEKSQGTKNWNPKSQIFLWSPAFSMIFKTVSNSINLLFSIKSPKSKLKFQNLFFNFFLSPNLSVFRKLFLGWWFQVFDNLSRNENLKF